MKVLVTCPPMIGLIDKFKPLFSEKGINVDCPNVVQTLSVDELKSLVQSIERLVPNYISISHDNIVSLSVPPEKILNAINQTFATDVPMEFRDIYINAYSPL